MGNAKMYYYSGKSCFKKQITSVHSKNASNIEIVDARDKLSCYKKMKQSRNLFFLELRLEYRVPDIS